MSTTAVLKKHSIFRNKNKIFKKKDNDNLLIDVVFDKNDLDRLKKKNTRWR